MRNFAVIVFSIFFYQSALAQVDTRNISIEPKAIYGTNKNDIRIRIGNGGAGATGLLAKLSEDYLTQKQADYSIAWYQDISPNTLKQLNDNIIDIALIYDKDLGNKAIKEGWAGYYTVIFNDHFIITGPRNNKAKIETENSAETAFFKIAKLGKRIKTPVFLSRDDNSGTNIKEVSIWKTLKMNPWEKDDNWYFKYHAFPKEALIYADQNALYTITDWATFISNANQLNNSIIYVRGGFSLLNQCFALLKKNPSEEALSFLHYLKSPRAQKIIENFGKDKYGTPLFTKATQMNF